MSSACMTHRVSALALVPLALAIVVSVEATEAAPVAVVSLAVASLAVASLDEKRAMAAHTKSVSA